MLTWNLHAGRGRLPALVDDLIAGRLTGMPPREFVLLLQESIPGTQGDVDALAAARGLHARFAAVRTIGARTTGNAIVSTLPLSEVRVLDLPRERQSRAALVATIDVDGQRLFVADAHLENRISFFRGGLFSDAARRRQAAALLRALPADGPGIAGGDFNTWLGANEPARTDMLARFPDTPAGPPAATFRDRLPLDHLFFDLPAGWTVTMQVIAERYGSDHHPVLGLLD